MWCLYRDIAMILCDPFAINTVSKSVIKLLLRLVNTESLPKVSFPVLQCILQSCVRIPVHAL